MDSLPIELIEYILSYISELNDFYSCILISKCFRTLIRHNEKFRFMNLVSLNRALVYRIFYSKEKNIDVSNINKKINCKWIGFRNLIHVENIWIFISTCWGERHYYIKTTASVKNNEAVWARYENYEEFSTIEVVKQTSIPQSEIIRIVKLIDDFVRPFIDSRFVPLGY